MTANGRHIGGINNGRRGTPPEWVEMARVALGGHIELDPMSEPAFNSVVRADRIFTAEDDCFKHDWLAKTVFINPHGGLVVESWRRLLQQWSLYNARSAIWIGFSVEQLNLLADEDIHPDDFSKLTVRKRIDFLNESLEPMGRPTHSNYVVGIGIDPDLFESSFAGRGRFSHGRCALPRSGNLFGADP